MIDSKNLNTLTLWSDALQINVPLNQLPKISVIEFFLNPISSVYSILFHKLLIFLKQYRASLFIDALIFFNKQIHQLIGKDPNRLFGLNNVSLKNSEIFINNTKGLSCSNNLNEDKWPLGRLIIENLRNVFVFSLINMIF